MQPIVFPLAEVRTPRGKQLGVGPSFEGVLPLPTQPALYISGVTKDSTGAPLANCVVTLYRTANDVCVEEITSDGSGNYAFSPVGLGQLYYIVAYKAGSPDVAGTTRNDLVGI